MNDRIPQTPPVIVPVPSGEKRPQWSVMIPAYNCIKYLKKTLESVLIQDPGPEKMQIEVIDDCSTDGDVEALVTKLGKGRVGYYRQKENRGSLRNFETCLNRSKGKWIHLLHGDDLVKPGFYQEIKDLFTQHPEAGAVFTSHMVIDENEDVLYRKQRILDKPGVIDRWFYKIARRQYLQPPAMVVKRSVYECLGGFFAVHYGEDWEMWVRIAAHYPVAYSPRHLAQYRNHNNNITSRSLLSGQNIRDIYKVIEIIHDYLPQEERSTYKRVARKYKSINFARQSHKLYYEHQVPEAALMQAKAALKMSKNIHTVYLVSKLHVKRLLGYTPEKAAIYRAFKQYIKRSIKKVKSIL